MKGVWDSWGREEIGLWDTGSNVEEKEIWDDGGHDRRGVGQLRFMTISVLGPGIFNGVGQWRLEGGDLEQWKLLAKGIQ